MTTKTKRHGYRRETPYPAKFNLSLPAEAGAAIRAEAEAEKVGVATVLRAVVERGLPLVRESNRKRRKKHRN